MLNQPERLSGSGLLWFCTAAFRQQNLELKDLKQKSEQHFFLRLQAKNAFWIREVDAPGLSLS